MSTPIDDAVADLFREIGDGWSVSEVVREDRVEHEVSGRGFRIPVYRVVIALEDARGEVVMTATGRGASLGSALALAARWVLLQGERHRRNHEV